MSAILDIWEEVISRCLVRRERMARPPIAQVLELAKRDPRLREGDLELDENAKVSRPDDPKEDDGGAYVQVWMWVPYDQ